MILTAHLYAEDYGPPPPRVPRVRVEVVEYWTRLYASAAVDHLIGRDPGDVIGAREEVAR